MQTEWLYCNLDCCFRMFRHPERPDLLSDAFLGSPEDASGYAVCTATKEEWLAEINGPDDGDDVYIGGGGVPFGCPIFQGVISAPWEEQ